MDKKIKKLLDGLQIETGGKVTVNKIEKVTTKNVKMEDLPPETQALLASMTKSTSAFLGNDFLTGFTQFSMQQSEWECEYCSGKNRVKEGNPQQICEFCGAAK